LSSVGTSWQTSRNLLRSCQLFGLTDMKILSDRKIFCRSEKKVPKNSVTCIMFSLAFLEWFTLVLAIGHLISPLVFIEVKVMTRFSCLSVRITDNFSASFGKSAYYTMICRLLNNSPSIVVVSNTQPYSSIEEKTNK
jgi:hypothetical protein